MSRLQGAIAIALSLGLLMVISGCQEKTKGMNDQEQTAPTVSERIQQLESELDRAHRDRAASEQQLMALQAELNRLREQLAKRPSGPASPAPGWESVPGGAMTSIEGTVLFDSGKATLKTSARQTLQQIADVIRQKFPKDDVYIFGHTDNEPIRRSGWKDNYELSCQRALSVVRALRDDGVEQHMAAAGWGEQLPLSENSSAAARQANRRVQIFAMSPQKALVPMAQQSAPPERVP